MTKFDRSPVTLAVNTAIVPIWRWPESVELVWHASYESSEAPETTSHEIWHGKKALYPQGQATRPAAVLYFVIKRILFLSRGIAECILFFTLVTRSARIPDVSRNKGSGNLPLALQTCLCFFHQSISLSN